MGSIEEFYSQKLSQHGADDPGALSYNSRDSQESRFRILTDTLLVNSGGSILDVLDVGCGVGDLFGYLIGKFPIPFSYTGLDLVPDMIDAAARKFPEANFICGDFLTTDVGLHDFTFSSGTLTIFFSTVEEQFVHVQRFIAKMFHCSKVACAFNLLDARTADNYIFDERYFYCYPEDILPFCRILSANLEVIDGYLPNDFTVRIYK